MPSPPPKGKPIAPSRPRPAAPQKTAPSAPPRRLYFGIAVSAAAVLLLEIGLTRVFSYTIWYHFAYLTISVALLGFGASGAVLAARPSLRDQPGFASAIAIVAALGVALCLLVVDHVSLDPLAITNDPLQFGRLMLYYGAVALPFFAGGFLVAVPLSAHPSFVSRLYFWDLVGAGIACGAVVPLIWWLGTPVATAASSIGFALAALAYGAPGWRRWVYGLAALLAAGLAIEVARNETFTPAPTKFVSRFLEDPASRILEHRWTPINRVDVVGHEPPFDIGSYASWGASPRYHGKPAPPYVMIGNDGDSCAVMYQWDGDPASLQFLTHHVLAAPYQLLDKPSVVAIGLGGGADVLNAVRAGASAVKGIEINPVTVKAGREDFRDWNGGILNRPEVEAVVAEGRSFLRSRDEKYDLIEINSVDTLSALSTGAYVLSESYLYTSDAVADYLAHLKPGGIFAMAVGDVNSRERPPLHTLRLASIVRRALERRHVAEPGQHVLIVASPGLIPLTHTLVKNEPFSAEEVAKLEAFAAREGFELWHRPDRVERTLAAKLLTAPRRDLDRLYATHPLRLDPTSDDSPFFFNFYKWRTLAKPSTYAEVGYDRTRATGQIVLVVMLAQAIVMSALLILLPLRSVPRATGGTFSQRFAYLLYFAALGAGFILLEISLIQRFVLFLGYPTYSLTVVMLSLLVSTGIGSLRTARVESRFEARLPLRLLLLAAVAAALVYGAPFLFDRLLGAPLPLRIAVSIALLIPLGLVLGGFFPLGIRIAERANPRLVPWAWAINGCATVIGTLVAVIAAMSTSFTLVTVAAICAYAVGVVSLFLAEQGTRGFGAH
jgi:SAM-dependent methyltransferase